MVRRRAAAALVALCLGLGAISFVAPVPTLISAIAALGVVIALAIAALTTGLAGWSEPASTRRSSTASSCAPSAWRADDEDAARSPTRTTGTTREDLFDPRTRRTSRPSSAARSTTCRSSSTRALEHVAVVVDDGGRRRRAYGLYQGDTVARDHFHDRIVIFRDTLVATSAATRPSCVRQVTRTVPHELAHHLGWDEPGVRGLGL